MNGVEYEIQVRAGNLQADPPPGDSAWSASVYVTPVPATTVSAVPTGLALTATANGFSWLCNVAIGATMYALRFREAGTTNAYTIEVFPSNIGQVTAGLSPGMNYEVSVAGRNSVGDSAYSSPAVEIMISIPEPTGLAMDVTLRVDLDSNQNHYAYEPPTFGSILAGSASLMSGSLDTNLTRFIHSTSVRLTQMWGSGSNWALIVRNTIGDSHTLYIYHKDRTTLYALPISSASLTNNNIRFRWSNNNMGSWSDGNEIRLIIAENGKSAEVLSYITGTPISEAPVWNAAGGSDFSWVQNMVITDVDVPAVDSGQPTPTYSASGLPSGVAFDIATRTISGTPTTVESGTITITAINSEGSDTYTYDYMVLLALPAASLPVWNVAGGGMQNWTRNTPITDVNVPAVDSGNPTPMYLASGLPSGVAFDIATRIISGTPTTVESGTITITAINSEGSDTYTYAYAILEMPSLMGDIFNTGWEVNLYSGDTRWTLGDLLDTSDEHDDRFTYSGENYRIRFITWRWILPDDMRAFHFSIDNDDRDGFLSDLATFSVYLWWADVVYEFPIANAVIQNIRPRWLGSQYLAPINVGAEGDPLGFIIAPSGRSPVRSDFGALPAP